MLCSIVASVHTLKFPAGLSYSRQPWPYKVDLSNGDSIEADLVISAIGVQPNTEMLPADIQLNPEDHGVLVDRSVAQHTPFCTRRFTLYLCCCSLLPADAKFHGSLLLTCVLKGIGICCHQTQSSSTGGFLSTSQATVFYLGLRPTFT